jgi:amidase
VTTPDEEALCFSPARAINRRLVSREISARELLDAHLQQIERVNPLVNAIVTLDETGARLRAAALDEALAHGAEPGALHGLPVAHKDTHRVAGMRTTFGSPIFAEHLPESDDLVVDRMRRAGANSVGKTNVPEFAAGSHTFNTVFGATRNPYDTTRSAGGSSGGAACALACGMQPIADGSDMGGSLRNPASFCNVVGMRPTPGLVPSVPAADLFGTLAVTGALARSADDLAFVLGAISGPDPRSPIVAGVDVAGIGAALHGEVAGLRVAFSEDLGGRLPVEREVREAVRSSVELLAGLGAEVREACPDLEGADEAFRTLRAVQFEAAYGELERSSGGQMKATIRENIAIGRRLGGTEVARANRLRSELFSRCAAFFEDVDLLLLPTSQLLPFEVDLEYPTSIEGVEMGDYLEWMASCCWISVPGLPACSVPVAFSASGLPVGVQLVGAARADRLVLEAAHGLEQVAGVVARRPGVTGIAR